MGVDICQRKRLGAAFFCVKADRNSLYCTYVVNGTSLVKVGQGNVTAVLVHAYRSDGGRDLLHKGKSLFPVLFICTVYQLLQSGAAQASAVPGCHLLSSL